MKTVLMTSPRNFVLATTHPWVLGIRKDEVTKIPAPMVPDALAAGMTLVAAEQTEEILAPKYESPEPANAAERERLLLSAIEAIEEKNDPKEFTAAGVPSAKAISVRVRFTVAQREISAMYDAIRKQRAEEKIQRDYDRQVANAKKTDVPVFTMAADAEDDK